MEREVAGESDPALSPRHPRGTTLGPPTWAKAQKELQIDVGRSRAEGTKPQGFQPSTG